MAQAKLLRLRCFLELVEVPVISAVIQAGPNGPLVASVQIPPLAEATRFLPRTKIDLFFWEEMVFAPPAENTVYATNAERAGESDEINQIVANDRVASRYALIFTGEIVGFTWTKNANNRSVVLKCLGCSNYWDYAYQYSNRDLFGPGVKAIFSGSSTNLFTDLLGSEGEDLMRLLNTKSVNYPALEGLLGGIVHLLEGIGGSYVQGSKIVGQNIFFTLAELRLRITQMITAYPTDTTAKRLMGVSGFDGLCGRTLSNLGSQVSIRTAINALSGLIFYETYPQPCPMFVPGTGGSQNGTVRAKISDVPELAYVHDTATSMKDALTEISNTPRSNASATGLEPTPSEIAKAKRGVSLQLNAVRQACLSIVPKVNADKRVSGVVANFKSAATFVSTATAKFNKSKDPFAERGLGSEAGTSDIDSAIKQLDQVLDFEASVTAKKDAVPSRLNQEIFRPDVWFSAPPRCNVLFPDMYHTLEYNRDWLNEPTRLLLKTNDEFFGEDELFDSYYFAPKSFTVKSQTNTLQGVLKGDILDHELYTGIVPKYEKMGEFNIFASRSATVGGAAPKVGMAQRATNFLYFKHRFAARQMQVTGKFNPYVAVGFPGLIIDKHVDIAILQRYNEMAEAAGLTPKDLRTLMGTHFLGAFTQVTHSLSQQGGQTSIVCSYPRQVEESVEFLGVVQGEKSASDNKKPATEKKMDVAALAPPRVGMRGPNGGEITAVRDVTGGYEGGQTQRRPYYDTKGTKAEVPVAIRIAGKDGEPEVTRITGDESITVFFNVYEVVEQIRAQKQGLDVPMEEMIRPGWYGDIWKPDQISEPYKHFFGIGAITEPHNVESPDGQSISVETPTGDVDGTGGSSEISPKMLSLAQGASIEEAAQFVVLLYSFMKTSGSSVEDFIRSYTWRPIANMLDMFGSTDLFFTEDGASVEYGIEGFHSRASGPYENLFSLVTPEISELLGIKRDNTASNRADTRKKKRDAVLAYVEALAVNRSILG